MGSPLKVAFLSDVHANFPALCKALETARRLGAERVFCAGDVVGFGPHPTEVVRLLAEQDVATVRGNMERKVLEALEEPKKLKKRLKAKGTAATAWAARNLGAPELEWLRSLPAELDLSLGGAEVLVVHGSPVSDSDYIYPSITGQGLEAKLGGRRPKVLVCGHSHIPFTRVVGGVRIVNCGSAGRPVDGDPRGSFALCEFPERGRVRARIVRFAYPLAPLVTDLESRQAPRVESHEYLHGISLKGE